MHLNRVSIRQMVLAALMGFLLYGCGVALNQAAAQPTTAAASATPADYYGLWTLLPPMVAIGLAVMTRQVVAALFVGTLVAAFMLLPVPGVAMPFADSNVAIRGVRVAVEVYVINAIADVDHIQIVLFTLTIGAMVGVVAANGGTRAVVGLLAKWANNSRRAQFTGWLGGHAIFFDDYANTMILGPTLRPLFDRLRISRAKLAYIVDSTAAPVASLVPIGTWIGTEIGYIDDGLEAARASAEAGTDASAFLEGLNGYSAFLASIGYRFYAVFALALVLVIALTRRDFGAMRRAELEAVAADNAESAENPAAKEGRWWYALLPVGLMVGLTVAILIVTGWQGFPKDQKLSLSTVRFLLVEADAYRSILYGALAGLTLAVLISVATRSLSTKDALDAGLDGMSKMFPAIVILVLAWSLSAATQALQLGEVISSRLQAAEFNAIYLPMAVFGAACLVSFATGSSWGTMGILCPVAVQVAAEMCPHVSIGQAYPLFYSTVGAVLAGAIFGDHCSPISDTTVLSSLATSCTLERHVWTQMPYALLAAFVAVGAGNVLVNVQGYDWWVGLLTGVGALLLFVLIFGRTSPSPVDQPGGP